MFKRFIAPVVALLCLASTTSASTLLFNAPTLTSSRVSDYGTVTGNGFRTYDDFQLTTGARIEALSWDFFSFDVNAQDTDPAPASDVNQWVVSFFTDNGATPGRPDTLIATQTFVPGDVTEATLGSYVFTTNSNFNVEVFRYSATLATPLLLEANTTYWLSVFAISDSLYPAATWLGSGTAADSSFQQTLGPLASVVNENTVSRNRAYALEGAAVPEPTTMLLVGVPFLAGAIRRRRNVK